MISSKIEVVPVILAAGQGKRMRSTYPKVLHPLAEKPLIDHVLSAVGELGITDPAVVIGHGADRLEEHLRGRAVRIVYQHEQLGTGHAVAQALTLIPDEAVVLVLYGDVPLVTSGTMASLVALASEGALAWLSVHVDDPSGFGRVLRDDTGAVTAIVEERDATPDQRGICEVNTGILAVRSSHLKRWIAALGCDNAQGEYYLTDCLALAVAEGVPVHMQQSMDPDEVIGINDRRQLAEAERTLNRQRVAALMSHGVTVRDPARLDIRGELVVGQDVEIDVGVILQGHISLGSGCYIGPYSILTDCDVAEGARIEAHSVIEQAQIGAGCRVGPFARLRPGTKLAEQAHVGNFVEVKNAKVGPGSKINHLSYIGDATLGADVNVGAGTITCNYDGANKHHTRIGDQAFIGSNTAMVAPVEVGQNATIGAGSVITRDAPAGKLTLARARQATLDGWKRPEKPLKE
ncbi:bifunctional UDP-N-acetylglucosamine diphosphorylase/glucosamine-1-phosphate N-acetyltransferase GlmU [Acidihalobacter ferrooxydans]|uniref:Bifunctional protein GlmU n=1 Tax=Acidihalobacter ferrooxydans TaxID=1765967 RepID=A0A1P8UKS3_9GAMM|nr:bifunctional UDP-N-acetylglucosamine diphosphorylase/glucosamine-1-phosphate N-acetyltransferase GlmU [Acidihalobacter ferrooxydans]APZ44419.1 UDP-N-acetylglucosamine diphosphorylase/glucosamine-1-phosphate N-acetyltransferase [Acidihalobacter ferrooxydans]